MLVVHQPGLQSTLQGAPRSGYRHLGVPYAGPADALSMALANHLVGNAKDETCLEITYGGFEAEAAEDCVLAVTGACGALEISGAEAPLHETLRLRAGDTLCVTPPKTGMRAYLAAASGFKASALFGSTSTYLPAGFGGFEGRALRAGDVLSLNGEDEARQDLRTPIDLRPVFSDAFAVRACQSAETDLLASADQDRLFSESFTVGRQATRMGIILTGYSLRTNSDNQMKSAPVFPGTVQCPPSGDPVILLSDAQTTGGYPRVANIARCDRHMLGQIRPGSRVQFLRRTPDEATRDLQEKRALFDRWFNG